MKSKKEHLVLYHTKCILAVLVICFSTTMISLLLKRIGVEKENLLMVSLVGVLVSTVISKGFTYGILTSVLSIFTFNYFFTEPLHTFTISDRQDILLLLFFSIAAVISGLLSSNFQKQTIIARENGANAQLLYEVTKSYLNLSGVDEIVQHTLNYMTQVTGAPCMIQLLPTKYEKEGKNFKIPEDVEPEVFEEGKEYSIRGLTSKHGVVRFPIDAACTGKTERMVQSIIYHMALVLDREYMYLEQEHIKLEMESEQLKSTLLRSISHDLRTPLTEISGAGNLIAENLDSMSREEIGKFIHDINTEAEWLTLTVQNILNMTRISDGKLNIEKEYESMDDLMTQAVSQLSSSYASERLCVSLPDKIVLVCVDGTLMVQVLHNLIDNAYKHSGEQSKITFSGSYVDGKACFCVSDNGCGIEPAILPHVFEGFVTMSTGAHDKKRGVGLGLSICQAIVTAHGGTIQVENNPEGGAKFTVFLPGDIA